MIEELKNKELDEVIASILFSAGFGVEKKELIEKLDITENQLNKAIERLKEKYSGECGIYLITYNNKIQLSSNPNYADCISTVLQKIREKQLTKKAMEVMAIIAYKQPITKVEIEKIRGVSCDHAVSKLVEYNLVCELGRLDAPGRPLLFGTTEEFLRSFGVQSIDELPSLSAVQVEEFKQEAEEEAKVKMEV